MVRVDPGHSATLRLPDGMAVSVPVGVVTRPGTLSATIISAPARAPSELMLTGAVYDLRLSGTTLRDDVRLAVPVILPRSQGQSAAPNAALLVYYSHSSGDWQPVNASYNSVTNVLTATSAHLSIWSVPQINPQQMLDAMHSALLGFLGVASSPRPDCPGSSSVASSGVQVTADTGDLVSRYHQHWGSPADRKHAHLRKCGHRPRRVSRASRPSSPGLPTGRTMRGIAMPRLAVFVPAAELARGQARDPVRLSSQVIPHLAERTVTPVRWRARVA